jgi:hypothetical protein
MVLGTYMDIGGGIELPVNKDSVAGYTLGIGGRRLGLQLTFNESLDKCKPWYHFGRYLHSIGTGIGFHVGSGFTLSKDLYNTND